MLLTPPDAQLFFKLHNELMFFANQRLGVVPDAVAARDVFLSLPPEMRVKVRDALVERKGLLQLFVEENPSSLPANELDIVRSWQYLVHGQFYIFRTLKKYTVFLSSGEQPVAYGVLALSQPFEQLIGSRLPVQVTAVLLPFKDTIICDGLMISYSISYGPGIRRLLNNSYKGAKERLGIVTRLPVSNELRLAKGKARSAAKPPAKPDVPDRPGPRN